MFNNKDFYPTPLEVIELMTAGETISGKVILEPSAGKGNIIDYLLSEGAKEVIACEINEDLRAILSTKCRVIEYDFLSLTSDRVSHIDTIIMNPPFSADDKHILHAYSIAPAGCRIISLCNAETVNNDYSKSRKQLNQVIDNFGSFKELGDCFTDAERKTGVNVGLIKIQKAGENYKSEFDGFFMEDEPEEKGENGIMSYNVVRDLVNRYVAAIKLYDQQLELAAQMNSLTSAYFFAGQPNVTMSVNRLSVPIVRADFKKDMQRSGWKFIFDKMNLKKNITRGLLEDINKFVEQQTQIPFTMKNIYHMLDMVSQTTGQRMDRVILEAFDRVTQHHHDNRQHIKGWKTNSHFLLTKKIIIPNMVDTAKSYGFTSDTYSVYESRYNAETISDLEKAICYCNGINYDEIQTLSMSCNRNLYGEWYESEFFKYKAFKVGTMHLVFKSDDILGKINQKVAKLKGYPLFEAKEQTAYQKRQTGRQVNKKPKTAQAGKQPTILATIKIKQVI